MASARARLLVIHWPSPGGRVRWPSRESAAFAITHGIPVTIHLLKAAFSSVHSASSTPAFTFTRARRSSSIPRPACCGLGSIAPMITRASPALRMASTHGGVRPCVEHGSSVTYMLAPLAWSGFFSAPNASISACASPAFRCQPRADNPSATHDHGADRGVWTGQADPAPGFPHGGLHEFFVFVHAFTLHLALYR